MNNYKNPNASIIGVDGLMFNQATILEQDIEYEDYGVFSNNNTYSVTFNPNINRPKIKVFQQEIIKRPKLNEPPIKTYTEPCVSITENGFYLTNSKCSDPPILPPYLQKPLNEKIQGTTNETDKSPLGYYKQHKIDFNTFV